MAKRKLAELLLRRKELQQKVEQLRNMKDKDFFRVRVDRRKVSDSIDEIVAQVPLMTAQQVRHEYDWNARQLRLVDAAIQQANWTTEVEIEESVMADYEAPDGILKESDRDF